MRVSLVTLCTLAACVGHDYLTPSQAQEPPGASPSRENTQVAASATDGTPLPSRSPVRPEGTSQVLFSGATGSGAPVTAQAASSSSAATDQDVSSSPASESGSEAPDQIDSPLCVTADFSAIAQPRQSIPLTLDQVTEEAIGEVSPSEPALAIARTCSPEEAAAVPKPPSATVSNPNHGILATSSTAGEYPLPVPGAPPRPEGNPQILFSQLPAPAPSPPSTAPATLGNTATTQESSPLPDSTSAAVPDTTDEVTSTNSADTTPVASEVTSDRDHQSAVIPEVGMAQFATAPETVSSPLERPPIRLVNFDTANQLPAGALYLSVGSHQTLPDASPGTGTQIYHAAVDWGISDNLQLGIAGQSFDDTPLQAINGDGSSLTWVSFAPKLKYQAVETDRFALGVQGSVEWLFLSSSAFATDGEDTVALGGVQVPMSYTVTPDLQVHLTPEVAFYPDTLNGVDFYGTTLTLGTGVSWQPSDRWLTYGTLKVPLGPGGNAIDPTDQSQQRRLLWTVGTRYNATPRVGVDLYATNGFGITPANSTLAFIPDGSEPLVGLQLNYTPDTGLGYRSSFRQTDTTPLSDRDRQLLIDGFTLTTAHTLEPGTTALSLGAGTNGAFNTGLAYSPDDNLQLEGILEEFGSEGEVSPADSAGDNLKYQIGARLRLLNQFQGDPVSLSARILGGRDTDADQQIGTFFAELPVTYQASSQIAFLFDPKLAAFGDDTRVGLGLGLNYEVAPGLQLIGEVTPVVSESTIWAVGTRYRLPVAPVSLDLYATNAIGRHGLGTLVGEPGARLGVNVNWVIGGR